MGSYKKKLFIALLLILLLNFFVCSSVNAVAANEVYNYSIDNVYALNNYQNNLATIFLTTLDKSNNVTAKNLFVNLAQQYNVYFTYFINSSGTKYIHCYFYPNSVNYNALNEVNNSENEFYDGYLYIPATGYNVDASDFGVDYINRFTVNLSTFGAGNYKITTSFYLPTLLIGYKPDVVINYINGVSPNSSGLNLILNAISENTEQQEETTNEMKKLNDFMSSEDVDQDAYDMPTNNPTQDPTTDGINNIFNKFYSRITNWDSSNISVFIPFANKSFTIPANASEQLLNKFSNMGLGSTLKSLINAVWFYVLGRYIVKDVQKYVDGLKTGEILTKSDTNIKTEML